MTGTVLIVDDDPYIVGLLQDLLQEEGYTVLCAVDGASTAVALRAQPDLILLDIMMPGMDGAEVSRRLRADPRTAQIPIITMTARGPLPAGVQADAVLPKPFDLDMVSAAVADWMPVKRPQHS